MNRTVKSSPVLEGTICLSGDKSVSMRAALLNSIAIGKSTISNFCVGDDRTSILRCLRGLGARIKRRGGGNDELFEIKGLRLDGLNEPSTVLNAGNSGTTIRLIAGLLAAQPFTSIVTGDQSLRSRPMGRIVEPLSLMGAQFIGRNNNSLAPIAIRGGNLNGIDYQLPVASAQIKSAILIAGLFATDKTTVSQPSLSRDHTERMLISMGAKITSENLRITVSPSELSALDIRVPGDISSAAFWIVAASLHQNARIRLPRVGINPTRTGILSVLESMGAKFTLENIREDDFEPVADIVAESSRLRGTEISGDIIPKVIDEIPILCIAAALAEGKTVIRDASELRVKESDRISATVEGLKALGSTIEEHPDGMTIIGVEKLQGATCNSYKDHRIAMSFGIAGLVASGETTIQGADAVGASYPTFWDILESVNHK